MIKPPSSTQNQTARIEACNDSTLLYISSDGAFVSVDSGLRWRRFDTLQLSTTDIVPTHDGHLIGASSEFGFVRTTKPFLASTASIVEHSILQPSRTYTIYPNPSAGNLQIVPIPSQLEARVVDINGKVLGNYHIGDTGTISLHLPVGSYWIVLEDGIVQIVVE